MYLPQTSGCADTWCSHGTGPMHLGHKMGSGCSGLMADALLQLLSTDDTKALLDSCTDVAVLAYYAPRYWQAAVAAIVHGTYPHKSGVKMLSYNDVWCATCTGYVSKELDPTHWDAICATCGHHTGTDDACQCCTACGYFPCECCESCGNRPGWCECCSHCGGTVCECPECEDCGNVEYNCSCNSSSGYQFGQTKKAPWLEREAQPIDQTLPTMSDSQHAKIDPLQAAANFYLLDAIKNNTRAAQVTGANDGWLTSLADLAKTDSMLSAVTTSANRSHRALVEYLLPTFLAYGVSAVGGELRYHRACGNKVLPNSRSMAWNAFVELVQVNGTQVLFDANDLFNEFGGGAYGGKKWGDAAKVVGLHLNGTYPDWLYIDRVFALQHNGGCFLNKVNWARKNARGWTLDKMQTLLNAHAADDTDWATLLDMATPEVRAMFEVSDRAIRRLARRFGGDLPRIKRSKYSSHSSNRYEPSPAW